MSESTYSMKICGKYTESKYNTKPTKCQMNTQSTTSYTATRRSRTTETKLLRWTGVERKASTIHTQDEGRLRCSISRLFTVRTPPCRGTRRRSRCHGQGRSCSRSVGRHSGDPGRGKVAIACSIGRKCRGTVCRNVCMPREPLGPQTRCGDLGFCLSKMCDRQWQEEGRGGAWL